MGYMPEIGCPLHSASLDRSQRLVMSQETYCSLPLSSSLPMLMLLTPYSTLWSLGLRVMLFALHWSPCRDGMPGCPLHRASLDASQRLVMSQVICVMSNTVYWLPVSPRI